MNSYYSYGRKGLIRHSLGKYNLHMYSIRLVLYVIALGTIGVLVINSAADGFARKQLMGLAGGLILMVILSFKKLHPILMIVLSGIIGIAAGHIFDIPV